MRHSVRVLVGQLEQHWVCDVEPTFTEQKGRGALIIKAQVRK